MKDKRGTNHSCSPSTEGSPSSSDAKTHPLVPSGSLLPPGSPSKISSCRPCSPVFEQGGSSGKAPVIDLSSSSDEEDLIAATSHALSSPKDSLVSSTALSWGRPMTARSSSSATPMKKGTRGEAYWHRRCGCFWCSQLCLNRIHRRRRCPYGGKK
jgi:hypothetical protein